MITAPQRVLTLTDMKLNHGELTLTGCETIQSSFPNYPQLMQQAGMRINLTY